MNGYILFLPFSPFVGPSQLIAQATPTSLMGIFLKTFFIFQKVFGDFFFLFHFFRFQKVLIIYTSKVLL
jgi:hypothetical protein